MLGYLSFWRSVYGGNAVNGLPLRAACSGPQAKGQPDKLAQPSSPPGQVRQHNSSAFKSSPEHSSKRVALANFLPVVQGRGVGCGPDQVWSAVL